MPGPRPKPSRLRELSGNAGHKKINRNEPRPKSAAICPPSLKDEAKQEWERIAPELEALGLLSSIDVSALSLYCEAFHTWRKATDHLREHGLVDKTPNNFGIPSPYISIANSAGETMRKALLEFGCSPASRSKVTAKPVNGPSSHAEFATPDPIDLIVADLEKRNVLGRHRN